MSKDTLTGLLDNVAFRDDFGLWLAEAKENGQPLTIATMDIDKFLRVNETHGREVGDDVLKGIAEVLSAQASENARIYRYWGDEFILLFSNTHREQAFLAMEEIRRVIEETHQYGSTKLNVKISGGLASFPVDGREQTVLHRKADQAMYQAKLSGSNQIRLAYDERMVPKTVHFTETQLERLSALSDETEMSEARLLREALDGLLLKYKDRK